MEEQSYKQVKNPLGVKRIFLALGYSIAGLAHASKNEPAFQQELMFLIAMSIVVLLCPFSLLMKVAILASHIFILVVELLNSAIEAVVDKASPEYSELAKQAKDMGSAAVLLSFGLSVLVWGYAVYEASI